MMANTSGISERQQKQKLEWPNANQSSPNLALLAPHTASDESTLDESLLEPLLLLLQLLDPPVLAEDDGDRRFLGGNRPASMLEYFNSAVEVLMSDRDASSFFL